MSDQQFPSFGQKLVGASFNPSGDVNVQEAKRLCAELADLLNTQAPINPLPPNEDHDALQEVLFTAAVADILKAQMMVVKVLTYKK